MTNAEKYLKNENYKKTLWYDFKDWYSKTKCNCPYGIAFEDFMEQQVKPSLTEDERIILRNIPVQEKYITRDNSGQLWTGKNPHYRLEQFEHLFQFIKERRRIRDKGVVEMNNECLRGVQLMNIKEKIEIKINQLTDYEKQSVLTMGIVPTMSIRQVIDMLAELLKEK